MLPHKIVILLPIIEPKCMTLNITGEMALINFFISFKIEKIFSPNTGVEINFVKLKIPG